MSEKIDAIAARRRAPVPTSLAILNAGWSMPSGLFTARAPSSGPAFKAEPTSASVIATTVNQTTARQRGVSGRPVGKSSGRNVKTGTIAKSQAKFATHKT